jgi:hypothetical protein
MDSGIIPIWLLTHKTTSYQEVLLTELPFHVRVHVVPVLADLECRMALKGGTCEGPQIAALVSAFTMARAQAEKIHRRAEELRRDGEGVVYTI